MSNKESRGLIAVTGATGKLGRLVIAGLLKATSPERIVALVRDPGKASDLAQQGVLVREADYDRERTLQPALMGVEKLLLVSSNKVGGRVPQHRAVIDAAKVSGVQLIAYTSVLRAPVTKLSVGEEHRQTEAILQESGVPWVLLRNGWYTEMYTLTLKTEIEEGVVLGSTGDGLVAPAARSDYAQAAAAVLQSEESQAGRIYELAGDEGWTMKDFASILASHAGRDIVYRDLPEREYAAALVSRGLPEPVATAFARFSAAAKDGELFDEGRQLSRLLRRPTTPVTAIVSAAISALSTAKQ